MGDPAGETVDQTAAKVDNLYPEIDLKVRHS